MPSTKPPIPIPSIVPAEISGRRFVRESPTNVVVVVMTRFSVWKIAARAAGCGPAEMDGGDHGQQDRERECVGEQRPPEVVVEDARPHLPAGAGVANRAGPSRGAQGQREDSDGGKVSHGA